MNADVTLEIIETDSIAAVLAADNSFLAFALSLVLGSVIFKVATSFPNGSPIMLWFDNNNCTL